MSAKGHHGLSHPIEAIAQPVGIAHAKEVRRGFPYATPRASAFQN
ncbi:hypothetical protein [Burkholderia cenocepacia]|nr:hypothetical protein [Burkholderia cenocepacia]